MLLPPAQVGQRCLPKAARKLREDAGMGLVPGGFFFCGAVLTAHTGGDD